MRPVIFVIGLAALVLAGGLGYYALQSSSPEPETANVPIGGPFELVDSTGETVTQENFSGRHMLVYFGYTYCPDICPVSLQNMVEAYAQLSSPVKAEVVPVFITVDPERDTVEVVKDYISYFDPALVGLTGSTEQVDGAKSSYRVYAQKAPTSDAEDADYLVDHSSFIYLVDGTSSYVTHFGHSATPEEMRSKIEELLG